VLTLYKVGARGRVQLEDLATEGDFYTAEVELTSDDRVPTGRIILSPVQVKTTSAKRGPAEDDPTGT